MPTLCSQIKTQYQQIKVLKNEFVLAYKNAIKTKTKEDRDEARKLKQKLIAKREALSDMLWPFEEISMQELKEHYEKTIEAYEHFGFLTKISNDHEGIIDEQGNEHAIPSLNEIKAELRKNKEFYANQMESMENPVIHLTPFAFNLEKMEGKYSDQIEEHFVEEKIEGEARIPDKSKTKLFGVDGEPLELRADKQNVYFPDDLKNLTYFPEWENNRPKNGMTKKQAIKKIGGWRIIITENIPLAPEKGQGEKEITAKNGKTKQIKQAEGGMDASQQYELIAEQGRQGMTLEDWISFAMLYLRKNNTVLDDDRLTIYYCRLLGAATAAGNVPRAGWRRGDRQADLDGRDPEDRYDYYCVRSAFPVGVRGS